MNNLFAEGRAVPALLIGPLAAPLIYIVGVLLLGAAELDEPGAAWMLTVLVFIVAAPVAYAATLVLGLPLIWFLRRTSGLGLFSLLLCSAAIGGLVYLGFMAWLLQGSGLVTKGAEKLVLWFGTGAALAASVAAAVWFIGGIGAASEPKG